MKLLVTDDHTGEGAFPVFQKGTEVKNIVPCDVVPHWSACSINGLDTFVPDAFLDNNMLIVDYDPTELALAKGDLVELQSIVYEWLYVKTKEGISGWLPASKAVTLTDNLI